MLIPEMSSDHGMFMFFYVLIEVAASVPNIVCITQITCEFVYHTLLVYQGNHKQCRENHRFLFKQGKGFGKWATHQHPIVVGVHLPPSLQFASHKSHVNLYTMYHTLLVYQGNHNQCRENRRFWFKQVKGFGKQAAHHHPIVVGIHPPPPRPACLKVRRIMLNVAFCETLVARRKASPHQIKLTIVE